MPLRIAFDLDDTLIPCGQPFASGLTRPGLLARMLAVEPLREGTKALFSRLRRRGCEIWVYTSSRRSAWLVYLQFAAYGLRIDGVINDQIHRAAEARSGQPWPLKYPPAFGIDLLVDDSIEVLQSSRRRGFTVVRVSPGDARWVAKVLVVLRRRAAPGNPPWRARRNTLAG